MFNRSVIASVKIPEYIILRGDIAKFFAQWIVSDSVVSKDMNFSTRHFDVKMAVSQIGQPLDNH